MQRKNDQHSTIDLTTKTNAIETIWREIKFIEKDIGSLKAFHSASKNSVKQLDNSHLAIL